MDTSDLPSLWPPASQIAPTDEEAALLRKYEGAFAELARPEQILSVLATVPRLRAKLQCLLFRCQADSLFTDAEAALRSVQAACEQVRALTPYPNPDLPIYGSSLPRKSTCTPEYCEPASIGPCASATCELTCTC